MKKGPKLPAAVLRTEINTDTATLDELLQAAAKALDAGRVFIMEVLGREDRDAQLTDVIFRGLIAGLLRRSIEVQHRGNA